jgi:DNA-binding transcriptional LysR family regulator
MPYHPWAMPGLLREFDLNELRTLCVAADMGTLGRASRRLHVSQPALSKRIANLEALAGTPLLDRTPQGVRLTAAGRRLYEDARPLLEHAAVVQETLASLAHATRQVRVAASHSAAEAFAGRALSHLGDAHIAIDLVVANSDRVRLRVANGKADVGVAVALPGQEPLAGTREIELADDEVVVAVPLAHPWARADTLTVVQFLQTPMVLRDPGSYARRAVEMVLEARHLTAVAPVAEMSTPQAVKAEARDRRAPLMLSRHILEDDLNFVIVPVDGLRFERAYVAVVPAQGQPSPADREVLDRLAAHAGVEVRAGDAA